MKCYFTTFLITLLLSHICTAQLADHFDDGNLDGWQGNVDHFIINASEELQLNAPSGSPTSWLYTPVTFIDSMEWEIYVRLNFAPSTSNQLKIYLGLTTTDPATGSGYYLEMGATGDMDGIDLKYQDGANIVLLASSIPGLVGTDPVDIRLKVKRSGNGVWDVYQIGIPFPELLFSTTHDLLPLSSLTTFGLLCKYTDTRRDKFIFDDIIIGPVFADVIAPVWDNIEVIDQQTLLLTFSETLDPASVNANDFLLSPGNLTPDQVNVDNHQVTLHFSSPFIDQQVYMLTAENINDQSGNIMSSTVKQFVFTQIYFAGPNDLLITEIMADPTPIVGLPDAEYIELFNNSDKAYELSDYSLVVGSATRDLPVYTLQPGAYVVITDDANEDLLSPFGDLLIITNMPGLTNSGTTLKIINSASEIIHEVSYDEAWYHDPNKADGGWSLEMINPKRICSTIDNWAASTHLSGGTPNATNSQWLIAEDNTGPQFVSLFISGSNRIELRFNEKLDAILSVNPGLFSFLPDLPISNVALINPTILEISFQNNLMEGTVYQLLPFQIFDCLGNGASTSDTLTFGIVAAAVAGDLLINEILFNPASGGSRFIEVINISQKFIDLSTISIARLTNPPAIYPTGVSEIINPGEIVVFTPDREDILSRYTVPHPENLFESSLPSWDDNSDNAAILSGGIVIDSFTYSASWHHPVISDKNGVSLERISITSPTSSASNWHSTSSLAGYATPTGPNSQSRPSGPVEGPFTLVNKNFSPNDDGFKDFLGIQFEPEGGNNVGSVWIYDLEGREIYQVLSNETLGVSSFVQWDGRNDEGIVSDMGMYIVYIQLWNMDGDVKEYLETCALVKR
ncbi:MAG: lamin tail domain-containing protein [Bacteroidota bacterium]|nr:lamin tail domain-containing protein [Bacteroidota bacterium]